GRGRGGGWLLCHRGQRQRAGQDGNGNGDRRGGAGHRGAPWGNRASSIAWRGVAPCLRGWALGDVHGRGECAGVAWPPGPRTDAHVSTRSLVTACGRCDRDVLRRGRPESLFVCQGARWSVVRGGHCVVAAEAAATAGERRRGRTSARPR